MVGYDETAKTGMVSCILTYDFETTFHFEIEGYQVSVTLNFRKGDDPFEVLDG